MLYKTEDLDDKFSDAFEFGWFRLSEINEGYTLPAWVFEVNEDGKIIDKFHITHESFWDALTKYAALPGGGINNRDTRTLADMYEDTDAVDDDNILQLACFNEIRYG